MVQAKYEWRCGVASGHAGCAKPDPRIFNRVLACLVTDARDALHVGDSVSDDVAGAVAAGARAVLVQRGAPSNSVAGRISDLRELMDCISP
ncbi:MAG: HAD-IA family hydrolase [Candidatus Binatia bacterium]